MNKTRRLKTASFTLEGLSSFATSLNSYYLYFYMQDKFGFGIKDNLAFAAFNGLVYTFAAWQAGRFAQRHGYFTALKVGFALMILAMTGGALSHHATGVIAATALFNVGMCFLWPTIEALVSEGGDAVTLPRAVGTYNLVWASTNALALFFGGTLVETFGFKSIFYVPLALCIGQLAATLWLEKSASGATTHAVTAPVLPPDPHRPSPTKTRAFLPTSPSTHSSQNSRT
jgi:MFS family permease